MKNFTVAIFTIIAMILLISPIYATSSSATQKETFYKKPVNKKFAEEIRRAYLKLSEMTAFPYIAQYLQSSDQRAYLRTQKLSTRAEAMETIKKDQEKQAFDPQEHKPLIADILETPLSHLLTWMTKSTNKAVLVMAVYDKNGVLQGRTSEISRTIEEKAAQQLPEILNDDMFNSLEEVFIHSPQQPNSSFPFVKYNIIARKLNVVLVGEGIYNTRQQLVGYMLFALDFSKK